MSREKALGSRANQTSLQQGHQYRDVDHYEEQNQDRDDAVFGNQQEGEAYEQQDESYSAVSPSPQEGQYGEEGYDNAEEEDEEYEGAEEEQVEPVAIYAQERNNNNNNGQSRGLPPPPQSSPPRQPVQQQQQQQQQQQIDTVDMPPPAAPLGVAPQQGRSSLGNRMVCSQLPSNQQYFSASSTGAVNSQRLEAQQQQQQQAVEVLAYGSPYLLLDRKYITAQGTTHTWDETACCGACCNQPCTCFMGYLCCCTAPCIVAQERRRLLFNDISGRYTCCAGAIPCCVPPPALRPELYMTIASSAKETVAYKREAIAPEEMHAINGAVSVGCITNKKNGLPQYGCYRPTRVSYKDEKKRQKEEARAAGQQQQQQQRHHTRPGHNNNNALCTCCTVECNDGNCECDCSGCCYGCHCCQDCGHGGSCCLCCDHPTLCCLACPSCCVAMEVCFCLPCAVLSNRMLIRQHYGLQSNAVMDRGATCMFWCCHVFLCGTRQPGAYDKGEMTCCQQCSTSTASLLAALCCIFPCIGFALAQHREQVERRGYPLLSTFRPPDMSGMN